MDYLELRQSKESNRIEKKAFRGAERLSHYGLKKGRGREGEKGIAEKDRQTDRQTDRRTGRSPAKKSEKK